MTRRSDGLEAMRGWAAADTPTEWEFPWNDTPQGSGTTGVCCVGCPGVSDRGCCSYSARAAFGRMVASQGVKGRRRGDWMKRFLAGVAR